MSDVDCRLSLCLSSTSGLEQRSLGKLKLGAFSDDARLTSVCCVAYIGPKSRTESDMPKKIKINIIGLSLLSNDVGRLSSLQRHAALTVGLPAPSRAGTGRILDFWAFAVDRSPAGPVIRLWRPGFTGPGRAGFKS